MAKLILALEPKQRHPGIPNRALIMADTTGPGAGQLFL
jgi:hypothetical protein